MVGVGFQGWNGKRMLVIVLVTTSNVSGFSCHQVSTRSLLGSTCGRFSQHLTVSSCPRPRILAAKDEDEREEDIFSWDPESGEDPIIIRGSDADEIDGSLWEDIETGQPPKWLVMKEVSGQVWEDVLGCGFSKKRISMFAWVPFGCL